MKHFKVFNTESEYNAYISSKDFIAPNVSTLYGCTSLTSCTIGGGVTSIGYKAFYNCSSLTSCTIGNGVTSIDGSAFERCSSLTSIDIPSGVTSIGNSAFMYCSGITSIVIPSSVTSIGNGILSWCTSLTSTTVLAITPPTAGTKIFDGVNNNTIYVPSGSVDAYKAASGWSTYASRIQAIP